MAKRNVDEFNALPRKSESYLTKAGKEQLFRAIEEFIDAKIELFSAEKSTPGINYPMLERKVKGANEILKEMLDAITIRVEG